MKIVYSWLKELVDLTVSAAECADALTRVGLEVAGVQTIRVPAKIKVSKLVNVSRHPNADRLTVCTVDDGGASPLTVVCGAPNVKQGMLAPLAVEGAVLGPEFTVKKTKLRGVESSGMLCSERELGLSDDHSGIMSLPDHYAVGKELADYYPDDAVIEIEILPSRGDCLSMVGVARELAARFGLPLKETAIRPVETKNDPVESAIAVAVLDGSGCPRYTGRIVRGITIRPSPEWMQRRLTLAGLRPINNIVDITNYLLLHFGQPMHAFDYGRIAGQTITVKRAGSDQRFTTLDATERALIAEDLLIADSERPVALAGIMGGAGSEISPSTTDVFIECAFFDPVTIRRTSKRLGLSSDSSYRFERGVDPDKGLVDALDTAAALMQRLGGGAVASNRIDVCARPLVRRAIDIRPSRTGSLLGAPFAIETIAHYLSSIGCDCEKKNDDTIQCTVPLFRHDLVIEADLIEEIGRLHGYDCLPAANHARISLNTLSGGSESSCDTLRNALAYAGFNEVITNSLTSEKIITLLTPDKRPVVLLNPLSPDMAVMRTTLAATMLAALEYNCNRKNINNKLFEIGKKYEHVPSGKTGERDLLGICIEGDWMPASWQAPAVPADFYTVKGVLTALADATGINDLSISPAMASTPLFDAESVAFRIGTTISGIAGRVPDPVKRFFSLKSTVFYIECDITDFLRAPAVKPSFSALPKFPAGLRDFCFVMPDTLLAGTIADEIRSLSPLVKSIRPFDLYRGEKLGPGLKSVTYSIQFQSDDTTLTEHELDPLCTTIIRTIEQKFGAKLRK
jgi:phenylalanyl-tRNA synthetase beta chain